MAGLAGLMMDLFVALLGVFVDVERQFSMMGSVDKTTNRLHGCVSVHPLPLAVHVPKTTTLK